MSPSAGSQTRSVAAIERLLRAGGNTQSRAVASSGVYRFLDGDTVKAKARTRLQRAAVTGRATRTVRVRASTKQIIERVVEAEGSTYDEVIARTAGHERQRMIGAELARRGPTLNDEAVVRAGLYTAAARAGDLAEVDSGTPLGSEPAYVRPAVVVSADVVLEAGPRTSHVVPVTSKSIVGG